MTKLEEFVANATGYKRPPQSALEIWKPEAEFWLRAFVKLVRERAKIVRNAKYKGVGFASGNAMFEAFNEIIKELGLEEP